MTPGARIQAAIEVMEHVQSTWGGNRRVPVDGLLSDYFKGRRYIGSKDRGAISELVYYCLRFGGTLEWHIEQCDRQVTPRRVVLVALLFKEPALTRAEITELFDGSKYAPTPITDQEQVMLSRCEGRDFMPENMPNPARYNYPDWMEGRLKEAFRNELPEAMTALNEQAPVDLRANLLKIRDRSDLILALDREGHFGVPTPVSPIGVRLKKRIAAFNTESFRDGMFEMQDAGSQAVALLVQAKPGQKVIDFCAGAGGKTLAIAATMQNKGRILAWDNSATRLAQMGKRLARAGVSNVQTHVLRDETDPYLKRHLASADWVMVDAPCSGSGTWRRNPDLKWRFTVDDLLELKATQLRILTNAARLVKPGGRLVYVTCSVFPDENFLVVKQFLGGNARFRVEAPDKLWSNHRVVRDGVGPCIQLSPHKDGTDGFFAAVLVNDPAASSEAVTQG
jgi:16S rRNA (cytosine967-C5)-methyltransferase